MDIDKPIVINVTMFGLNASCIFNSSYIQYFQAWIGLNLNYTVGYVKYSKPSSNTTLIAAVVSVVAVIVIVIIVIVCLCRRNRSATKKKPKKNMRRMPQQNVNRLPRADKAGRQQPNGQRGGGSSIGRDGGKMQGWISNSYFRMSEYFRNQFARYGGEKHLAPVPGDRFEDVGSGSLSSYVQGNRGSASDYDYRAGDPYGRPYSEGYGTGASSDLDYRPSNRSYNYYPDGTSELHSRDGSWMPNDQEMDQIMNDRNYIHEGRPQSVEYQVQGRDDEGFSLVHLSPAKKLKPKYKKSITRDDRQSFTPSSSRLTDIGQDVIEKQEVAPGDFMGTLEQALQERRAIVDNHGLKEKQQSDIDDQEQSQDNQIPGHSSDISTDVSQETGKSMQYDSEYEKVHVVLQGPYKNQTYDTTLPKDSSTPETTSAEGSIVENTSL